MIEVRGLTKAFGSNIALDAFEITIQPGEIIGVIGENGAGKSTFMKLLSGVHQPSSGSISIQNTVQSFPTPRDAQREGIAMVHQELNLIPGLSAADNIFLGRELGGAAVDRKSTQKEAAELLKLVGASFGEDTLCGELSVAQQQLVEIAKAISQKPKLIIFDEPTAVLGERESEDLFSLIRGLKERGVAVLYVSHRLPEILSLTDRLVVLRDGVKVGEYATAGQTESTLADLMVGRPLADIFPPKVPNPKKDFLAIFGDTLPHVHEVTNLISEPSVKGISLSIQRGEIVGIAGLIGSGRIEFAEAWLGLRPSNGPFRTYKDAMKIGYYYISEDRKGKGLVTSMSIKDNIVLAGLGRMITMRNIADVAKNMIEKLSIKVADPELPMTSLSGGNQQKCSIAKWLTMNPNLLILDEPTRGVDVGAKAEIYALIAQLAAQGTSCVVISSEMPEIVGLCHRALVFRDGRIEGELGIDELSEANIMRLAAGVKAA